MRKVRVCFHEGNPASWSFEYLGDADGACDIDAAQASPLVEPTITCIKTGCRGECTLNSQVVPDHPNCIDYFCECDPTAHD